MINLLNNIDDYNGKYVEVEGKFEFYFEKSSLSPTYFDFFRKHRRALWINLSEKNPLYLPGTNESLTESIRNIEGLNDKKIIIHGKVNTSNHGHLSNYAAEIDSITSVIVEK